MAIVDNHDTNADDGNDNDYAMKIIKVDLMIFRFFSVLCTQSINILFIPPRDTLAM